MGRGTHTNTLRNAQRHQLKKYRCVGFVFSYRYTCTYQMCMILRETLRTCAVQRTQKNRIEPPGHVFYCPCNNPINSACYSHNEVGAYPESCQACLYGTLPKLNFRSAKHVGRTREEKKDRTTTQKPARQEKKMKSARNMRPKRLRFAVASETFEVRFAFVRTGGEKREKRCDVAQQGI